MTSYSSYLTSEWNNAPERICPECRGTGLDRDEIYDCETCYGEGVLVDFDYEAHPGTVEVSVLPA